MHVQTVSFPKRLLYILKCGFPKYEMEDRFTNSVGKQVSINVTHLNYSFIYNQVFVFFPFIYIQTSCPLVPLIILQQPCWDKLVRAGIYLKGLIWNKINSHRDF